MGEPTGFNETQAQQAAVPRRSAERAARLPRVLPAAGPGGARAPGRPLHGLRHAVLPSGLPARQPDPGLERPRLPGQWERALAALHATNNFPEFTGRICPAPCEASCVARRSTRTRSRSSTSRRRSSTAAGRRAGSSRSRRRRAPARRSRSSAPGPAGMAAAQQLNRAGHTRHRVRARQPHRRPAALGIPDFKLEKRVVERRLAADGGRGRRLPDRRRRRRRRPDVEHAQARLRRRRARIGSTVPRDLPMPGPRAQGRPLRDGVPDAAEQAQRRRRPSRESELITAEGQARRHPRRRRHRRRLPRHRAPPGRRVVRQFEMLPEPPAQPRRRTTRGRSGRSSSASPPRTKRAASATTTRCRPSASCGSDGRSRSCTACASTGGQRKTAACRSSRCPAPSSTSTPTWCCWRWASSTRSEGAASSPGRGAGPARQRQARRQQDDQRAGHLRRRRHAARPVAGRLGARRGPQAARGVDLYLMGETELPAPVQ